MSHVVETDVAVANGQTFSKINVILIWQLKLIKKSQSTNFSGGDRWWGSGQRADCFNN